MQRLPFGPDVARSRWDAVLRVIGGALAVIMGAGSAYLEIAWTYEFWLLPVGSAVVGNFFLIWFVQSTVEHRWAWLFPAVPWFIVMIALFEAAPQWPGIGTLAAGGFVFFMFRDLWPGARFSTRRRPAVPSAETRSSAAGGEEGSTAPRSPVPPQPS